MTEAIVMQMQMNAGLVQRMTGDIPEERMYEQPAPLVNHVAWQLGHLTQAHAAIAELLGQPGPVASKDFDSFKQGSKPVTDAGQRRSREFCVSQYLTAQKHLAGVIARLTPEALAQPNPIERIRPMVPTVLNLVLFVGAVHDGWHIGNLCDLRRAMGLPGVL